MLDDGLIGVAGSGGRLNPTPSLREFAVKQTVADAGNVAASDDGASYFVADR